MSGFLVTEEFKEGVSDRTERTPGFWYIYLAASYYNYYPTYRIDEEDVEYAMEYDMEESQDETDSGNNDDNDDMLAVDEMRSNFPETWLWTESLTGYITYYHFDRFLKACISACMLALHVAYALGPIRTNRLCPL